MQAREFDVVLFGATGFTGRLVAHALAARAPAEARVALAGRSSAKLEAVSATLGDVASAWPRLEADASDTASLARLAHRTAVVCTTVGPYGRLGMPLVAACATAGTHLVDLCGEVPFMRDSIDAWHDAARRSGARIVHACGFDSVPSDLGVWLLGEALGPMRRATAVVEVMKGGFSGGTAASVLDVAREVARSPRRRRLLRDARALAPPLPGSGGGAVTWPGRDALASRWLAPFLMAPGNVAVVHRSNALLGYPWGRAFAYREGVALPRTAKGLALALATSGGIGPAAALLGVPWVGRAVERRLPPPGDGPDEATRRRGRLRVRLYGEGEDGRRATVVVAGEGDPGYQLTSVMLAEAALAQAFDGARLTSPGGVLTPASAFGGVLVERLRAAGLTLAVGA